MLEKIASPCNIFMGFINYTNHMAFLATYIKDIIFKKMVDIMMHFFLIPDNLVWRQVLFPYDFVMKPIKKTDFFKIFLAKLPKTAYLDTKIILR